MDGHQIRSTAGISNPPALCNHHSTYSTLYLYTHLGHIIPATMPLDSSIYAISALRLDGRRWNELRRIQGSINTQASADGSSYFEMGNTKIICTVNGPQEQKRGGGRDQSNEAKVEVEIGIAGFSGVDRKRRTRNDK